MWIWETDPWVMARLALIPIAVLLAAGSVVLGAGEPAPAVPARTSVTQTGDMGNEVTNS